MIVTPIKTSKIHVKQNSLFDILDTFLPSFNDKSVLVVTSKIVSLCEGNVAPISAADKETLIQREADKVLEGEPGKYGIRFTITKNTLIPTAGIDESNTNGYYVLWPKTPQFTANKLRRYLTERFKIRFAGVIICDSTCSPLRWGTSGISIAHSGFKASNDYVGQRDIFGREFKVSRSNIAGGLAASAVVTMGEGAEQTPMCVIKDVPFVQFQARNPSNKELKELNISPQDDLFAPFLLNVPWKSKRGAI